MIYLSYFLIFLVSILDQTNANEMRRSKRDELHEILVQYRENIEQLENKVDINSEIINKVKGFFNAIKIGSNDSNEPCGDFGWKFLTVSTCIKFLPHLKTVTEGLQACHGEYNQNTDLQYPQLLSIETEDKQKAFTNLLPQHTEISSIWLNNKIGYSPLKFSNWSPGSPANLTKRKCIELRNDPPNRGLWMDISCNGRTNNVVCEKSVPVPYFKIVNKQIELGEDLLQLNSTLNANLQTVYNHSRSTINQLKSTFENNYQKLEKKYEILESLDKRMEKTEKENPKQTIIWIQSSLKNIKDDTQMINLSLLNLEKRLEKSENDTTFGFKIEELQISTIQEHIAKIDIALKVLEKQVETAEKDNSLRSKFNEFQNNFEVSLKYLEERVEKNEIKIPLESKVNHPEAILEKRYLEQQAMEFKLKKLSEKVEKFEKENVDNTILKQSLLRKQAEFASNLIKRFQSNLLTVPTTKRTFLMTTPIPKLLPGNSNDEYDAYIEEM